MAYTKYSLTPANNNAAPPDGAPEGMLPSAVNDTMRDMMAQIRDVGDGIRGGTYTMTAPVITGGSITGVALSGNTLTNPVITGGSINNTTVGATTRSTGAFTTLASNGATTFTAGTASTSTTTGTAVITGGLGVSGRINAANFDGIVGANTAAAGNFTTLGATGVATFSAGTNSAPAITTTGDTNTGIFFPAADTIAFAEGGVESMRIDSAGNVGIGVSTIAANSKLSVSGGRSLFTANSEAFSVGVRFASSGADYYYIGASNSTSPDLLFSNAAGSERMRITSAGFVGIGNTAPTSELDVNNTGSGIPAIRVGGFSGGTSIIPAVESMGARVDANGTFFGRFGASFRRSDGTAISANNIGVYAFGAQWGTDTTYQSAKTLYTAGIYGIAEGAFTSATAMPTAIAVRVGSTGQSLQAPNVGYGAIEAMRITSTGNVGIGTSSPSVKLNVKSDNQILLLEPSTTTAGVYQTFANGTGRLDLGVANSTGSTFFTGGAAYSGNISVAGAYPLILGTNGTERMRIDSSGNLLVGTTTSNSAKLRVEGGADFGAYISSDTATSATIVTWNKATSGDNQFVGFYTEGSITIRGSITYNRAAGLTVYNTTSDYRAKDIISPVTNSGEVIDSVPVYMGKMKGATQERPMFIAHETPDYAHTGEKDAVDKDGNPVYQQMDASSLVPVLWAEIQSLRKRVAQLESK